MSGTGAVVVTFFPDAGFERRLGSVAREFSPVIVVDNSADPVIAARLRAACAPLGVELVLNSENRGLGAALNQACEWLARSGRDRAVAFDQDSTPAEGFGAALRALADKLPACAVVGANWTDAGRPGLASRHLRPNRSLPFLFERVAAAEDLEGVTCVITSGSLFRLDMWRALGGFDESLFLDLVDTDYCLRACGRSYTIAVAARALLTHHRGAKREVQALGRAWWPAFMSTLRLRYQWRNRLRVIVRRGWRTPHWVMFETVYALKTIAEIVLLEDGKGAKLGACILGLWDGLRGRSGKIG